MYIISSTFKVAYFPELQFFNIGLEISNTTYTSAYYWFFIIITIYHHCLKCVFK